MTSQIGGAEIFEINDKTGSIGKEIPQLKSSPSPSKIKKHEEMQQIMYGPLIENVAKIYNIEPLGRAPEIDADTKEMVDKITGYIKQIMDALNISFDEKGYQSFMKEMGHKLYTFMKQGGHSKSNSKGKRGKSKGRMWKTVRGGMKSIELPGHPRAPRHPRARAESPVAGHHHQPPPPPNGYEPDEEDPSYEERSSRSSRRNSSSVSWKQHFIMLFLLLSSIFMVYIASVKFHQTLATITPSGTLGDAADIADEIREALRHLESGDFLQYIFRIFSKPQADIEVYYTGQLAEIIKNVVDRSVRDMSAQIKATCGGDPIFQEGALAVGHIDFTEFVNVITNAVVSTLNSGPTTECITKTVQAMTREQFHKIETQIALVVAKILHGKNVISWLLTGASAFGVPAVGWYSRFFGRKIQDAIRKRRGVSAAHERPGSPRGDGEFPALPAPGGGGRKTRYRFRRVVKRRTRKH
jgi:hypothetical protein